MKLLNHIGIVVRDLNISKQFLEGVLGYKQHSEVESWFVAEDAPTIHVIEIDDAEIPSEDDMFHYYTHVAFEVPSLVVILEKAINLGLVTFQMDMEGNESSLTSVDDKLAFGIKTLFIRDKDNNLWEFLQKGHSYEGFWSQ